MNTDRKRLVFDLTVWVTATVVSIVLLGTEAWAAPNAFNASPAPSQFQGATK